MTDLAATLPVVGTPVIDPTGQVNEVWYRFFYTLLLRSGGTEGDDLAKAIRALALLTRRFAADQGETSSVVAFQRVPPGAAPEPVTLSKLVAAPVPEPVHNHGLHQDGGMHAVADANNNGFMSASDFTKLSSMTNDTGDWARVAKASLPTAMASRIGWKRFVTDATGATGIVPAYCDGTAWKRFADDSVVN